MAGGEAVSVDEWRPPDRVRTRSGGGDVLGKNEI